jgi:hypothetical protein
MQMRTSLSVLMLLLAGCAGPIETRVTSSGVTTAQTAGLSFDKDISGPAAEAQGLIVKALADKGYQIKEPADYSLQVSVSDRPSQLALHAGDAVLGVAPKRKQCAAREYRLGVTITRISDAMVAYNGHAAEYHCKQTLQQALPFLVAAALNDVGTPRGSYVVKRRR